MGEVHRFVTLFFFWFGHPRWNRQGP